MKLLTPKQVQEKYHWSYMTWYRRREDCLLSPYEKAIKFTSQKRCVVDEDKFDQFVNWRSQNLKKERFGLI